VRRKRAQSFPEGKGKSPGNKEKDDHHCPQFLREKKEKRVQKETTPTVQWQKEAASR